MKKTLIALFVLQVLSIFSFVYFGDQAGQAMDKTGVGDLEKWDEYNNYAGYSFYFAFACWLTAIIVSKVKQQFHTTFAQIAIGLPPILLFGCWVLLWFP